MIESVLLKIADIDLNARDMQIFNAYSNKKAQAILVIAKCKSLAQLRKK